MMKFILPVASAALLLASCGPNSDDVASGKSLACEIKGIEKQLTTDADNQELKDKLVFTSKNLETLVGDDSALSDAIQEAAKNCD